MKTFALLVGVALGLAPCAFSQQLIADSIVSPGASAGTNSILALGNNVSTLEGGIAVGEFSYAGLYSTAIGGWGSRAEGIEALALAGGQALGYGSSALGRGNWAIGDFSFASGYMVCSSSDYSIAIGSKNLSFPSNYGFEEVYHDYWVEDAILFELGNGIPSGQDYGNSFVYDLSNAITTLKNGRTTLTNKAWLNRDSSISPTADPSVETTDSGGEALVVEGHTRLKGKVTIEQPQGDISMGIYQ